MYENKTIRKSNCAPALTSFCLSGALPILLTIPEENNDSLDQLQYRKGEPKRIGERARKLWPGSSDPGIARSAIAFRTSLSRFAGCPGLMTRATNTNRRHSALSITVFLKRCT